MLQLHNSKETGEFDIILSAEYSNFIVVTVVAESAATINI